MSITTLLIDKNVHRRLKIQCVQHDLKITEVGNELIEFCLDLGVLEMSDEDKRTLINGKKVKEIINANIEN